MATLGTLRGMVRNLVLERTGDNGLITDTEANEIINIAARLLFVRIVAKWPEAAARRSGANVVVPSSGVLGFSTITSPNANRLLKILDIRAGATGAAETAMRTVKPFGKVTEKGIYEGSTAAIPSRYFVEGNNVVFAPLPAATFDCRVTWVQMPTDMTTDVSEAWSQDLTEYHDVIAVLASIMVFNKDQNKNAPFTDVFAYLERSLEERLGPPGPYDSTNRNRP